MKKKSDIKTPVTGKAEASPFDSLATSPAKESTAKSKKEAAKKGTKAVAKAAPSKAAASKRTSKKTTDTASVPAKKSSGKTVPVSPFVSEAAVATEVVPVQMAAVSPVFKALAEPILPELPRENRARLMMQTPTELYFYWSVRENPYHLLKKAFGSDTGSYTLVVKLSNLNTGEEEIHPVEAEGSWWFHVEANGKYEAEIGFYAPNRPYFRIIYSNTIETPRRAPSPRPATEAVWTVSANKFAEVLEVAGFRSDAIDVALAGDDHAAAEVATQTAFSHFAGINGSNTKDIAGEDIRYALRALASGQTIDDLRGSVGPKLFGVLQSRSADLSAENAINALAEYFDVDGSEYMEEDAGSAVYGASLVNFPRTMRPRRNESRFAPVSSHSYLSSVEER